jgi:CHASE1-domain containing sensor protein
VSFVSQFGSPSTVSPPRPEYYPISYLDPLAGNTAVVLLDMLSHPTRQSFVTTARDTATPQVTSPVSLLQFTELPLGCVVMTPVYNITCGNISGADVVTRQTCMLGVVMGVFRFSVLLQSFLETFQGQSVAVTMSDNGTVVFVGSTGGAVASNVTVYPTNHTLPTSDRVATYASTRSLCHSQLSSSCVACSRFCACFCVDTQSSWPTGSTQFL